MVWCNVCTTSFERDELDTNYRGMRECPDCGTELEKDRSHDGGVKRDQHSNKV